MKTNRDMKRRGGTMGKKCTYLPAAFGATSLEACERGDELGSMRLRRTAPSEDREWSGGRKRNEISLRGGREA